MENLDFNTVLDIENTIGNYYNLAKEIKPNNFEKLISFNDIDLETYLAETGSLDIDFKKLLKLD